jgi:hypothetical protein
MRKVRTLEAERKQVLRESVSMGAKEDSQVLGGIGAAGFHHVTARFRLAGGLKLTSLLFL